MHPFLPRPINFLGIEEHNGWRLKLYSILFETATLDRGAFAPGLDLALAALPDPAVTAARQGLGFGILHHGRGGRYVILGWWDNENELPVRVFLHQFDEEGWRVARDGESFCVWDLEVISFERDAYVATLLADPQLEAGDYLQRVLLNQLS